MLLCRFLDRLSAASFLSVPVVRFLWWWKLIGRNLRSNIYRHSLGSFSLEGIFFFLERHFPHANTLKPGRWKPPPTLASFSFVLEKLIQVLQKKKKKTHPPPPSSLWSKNREFRGSGGKLQMFAKKNEKRKEKKNTATALLSSAEEDKTTRRLNGLLSDWINRGNSPSPAVQSARRSHFTPPTPSHSPPDVIAAT